MALVQYLNVSIEHIIRLFLFGDGREKIISLCHECFQTVFLNLVLYYNMCFSKILTLGFVQRNEEGHEKRLFHPSCGISVTIAESDRNERLGWFNSR